MNSIDGDQPCVAVMAPRTTTGTLRACRLQQQRLHDQPSTGNDSCAFQAGCECQWLQHVTDTSGTRCKLLTYHIAFPECIWS